MGVPDELKAFDFQYHTALVFFLHDPSHFLAIGSEKETEDCLLKTTEGKSWYIQCKYSSNRETPNKKATVKALVDLKKHSSTATEKLILATNVYYPFVKKSSLFLSHLFLDKRSFAQLHSEERKKLESFAREELRKRKGKPRFDKEDIRTIEYAYLNYDIPQGSERDSEKNPYLLQALYDFCDKHKEAQNNKLSKIASNWIRVVEANAKSKTRDPFGIEPLVSKGNLVGAFCNAAIVDTPFATFINKYGIEAHGLTEEIAAYLSNHEESVMDESIEMSYSIWCSFCAFRNEHKEIDAVNCRELFVTSATYDPSKAPAFVSEAFSDKGEETSFYRTLLYQFFVACVVEQSHYIEIVRRAFSCED